METGYVFYVYIYLIALDPITYKCLKHLKQNIFYTLHIFDGSVMITSGCKNPEARGPIVVLRKTFPPRASGINAAGITNYFFISEMLYECVFSEMAWPMG